MVGRVILPIASPGRGLPCLTLSGGSARADSSALWRTSEVM